MDTMTGSIPGFSHHRRLLTDGLVPSPSTDPDGPLNIKSRSPQSLPTKSAEAGSGSYSAFDRKTLASLPASATSKSNTSKVTLTAQEALSALLLALPYPIVSYLFSEPKSKPPDDIADPYDGQAFPNHWTIFVTSLALTSLTMILLGTYGKLMEYRNKRQEKKSLGIAGDTQRSIKFTLHISFVSSAIDRILAVGLPIWSAFELGGSKLAIILLLLAASSMIPLDQASSVGGVYSGWEKLGKSRRGILLWLCLSIFSSAYSVGILRQIVGSSTLLVWLLAARSPYQALTTPPLDSAISPPPSAKSTSAVPATPIEEPVECSEIDHFPASPLIRTTRDTHLTLLSGTMLATLTLLIAALTSDLTLSIRHAMKISSCTVFISLSLIQCKPVRLRTGKNVGCLLGIATSLVASPSIWQNWTLLFVEGSLSMLGYLSVQYDNRALAPSAPPTHKHAHHHKHHHTERPNALTKLLMRSFQAWPLLHEILHDGNSRRIFYFMNINFAFMFVQMVYGYLTGSLGLISDSIHMLFDCVALLVGLCAVVLSNWPPSDQYPFGYGKLDQLAGLGNGVFLLLVTVEIFYGAFERLAENRSLERVDDLLIVSVLGLLVNIYGMFAFDHGHDHGHGHHHHHHDSDNMRGIYLHILGDALGSVGVVVSTLLVRYTGWNGWDPIASCIIAIVIGMHALPLVKRTAQSLLMALPDDAEYTLRNTLAGVSSLRGVIGYSTPKFWLAPGMENEHNNHHHHDDHNHSHHSHDHSHQHEHHVDRDHSREHHDHQCDHGHSDSHVSSPERSPTPEKASILGIIHIIVSKTADLEQVRRQAAAYFQERNMDIVIQVEREGDGRCWCGGGPKSV